MTTSPIPLDIPPGVVLSTTSVAGRFVACDHIRFENRRVCKIGGWQKAFDEPIDGIARGSLGWTTIAGSDLLATGTASKLYSLSDTIQNITPFRAEGTLANDPFAVTIGDNTVIVTHASHGLDDGVTAVFAGASAGGGITIDGAYVVTYIDANSYSIEHTSAATSTDSTTGGAAVTYGYELNPGFVDSAFGLGYGAGGYGEGTFGTPRETGGVALDLQTWSFGVRNGILYALPTGGYIYTWDEPNNDERAVLLTNSPTASYMFITPEGIVVALGTTYPMAMAWCDRDDPTVWTAAEGNTANEERILNSGNKLIAGAIFGTVSLLWSDTSAFLMQFLSGNSEVYATDVIGEGAGLIGPCAFAISPGAALWMSANTFHLYNGAVSLVPNVDDIREAIFGPHAPYRMDRSAGSKYWGHFNARTSEAWFGYVSVASPDGECDRYVKVRVDNWAWDIGSLSRTTMATMKSPSGDVVMCGADSYVYDHEVGHDADGAAMEAYIETGVVALANGKVDIDIDRFIPDFDRQSGDLTLEIFTKEQIRSTTELERVELTIAEGDETADCTIGGRYAGFRLTSDVIGGDFKMGIPLLQIGGAGATD